MWPLKSSFVAGPKNAVHPPIANPRGPDEEGAVVMDRPLFYANVTPTEEVAAAVGSDEEGLTVVPAAEDEDTNEDASMTIHKEDDKEEMSELSLSPNQFTESLLAAVKKFEDKKLHTEDLQARMSETPIIKADPNSVQVDGEDEEGVLVEELTKEEEAILATLDATTGSIAALIPEQTPNANVVETVVETEPTIQVTENDTTALQLPPLDDRRVGIDPDAPKMDEGASLSPEEVTAAMEAAKTETAAALTNMASAKTDASSEELVTMTDILLPVWQTFTTVVSFAAFAALALGEADETMSTPFHHPVDFVPNVVVPNVEETMTTSPPPVPPRMTKPPLALTWFSHEDNSTDILDNAGVAEESGFSVEYETDIQTDNEGWSGWSKFACLTFIVVAYYLALMLVSSSGSKLEDLKKKAAELLLGHGTKSIKQEPASLNSFEDLLDFQKTFVGSGKGRRGRRSGKVDADSYLKLTRDELVRILEGFGHYPSSLIKPSLIEELRSVYAGALYNFSNPQILEILKAKGFSVNTPMTKQDLVSMAVKVGF